MRILPPVSPTPEQLTILGDNKPGFTLIRGAAGSGKTTTALLRLHQLCEYWMSRRARLGLTEPVRVLVLTYNRTLEGYIAELARQQVTGRPGLQLDVSTFGKWATSQLDPVNILDHNDSARLIRPKLRGLVTDTEYFTKEIEYVLSRFEPGNLAAYLGARREGRGVAPRVDQALRQRLLDEVVAPYVAEKARLGVRDWNDIAVDIANLDPTGRPTWDVVVVDEAQDFSANQVRGILAHLSDPSSVTFVIDAAQRIYPRFFTWREAGISAFSSQYALNRNYRNTRQIAAFAAGLLKDLPVEDDGTMPDFNACTKDGPLPMVVEGRFSGQLDVMLRHLVENVDLTSESVAFLHPLGGGWFDYVRNRLRDAGLPYAELTRASTWPTGAEAIALSTLASAKGLEFDHVLMPGLNQQVTPHGAEAGDGQLDTVRRLVAMGVGRARKSVVLGYKGDDPSTIIGLLDPSTYNLVKTR